MKILRAASVLLFIFTMLTGCGTSNISGGEISFSAKVLEITGNVVTVEPVEGEDILRSADRITINTENLNNIDPSVGDIVTITYTGGVMETYPAQVKAVSWTISEKNALVSVGYATNELLSEYGSLINEYIEFEDEGYQKIMFTTTSIIRDFKFIEIAIKDEAANFEIETKGVLYSLDELLPEKPFVVTWMEWGNVPHRGVSFADETNTIRYFYIATSGEDGSLLLVEFESSQKDVAGDAAIEWIFSDSDIDMEGMNLYWQHDNIQLAADDNATLSLYVNAEKYSDGRFLFDDGQDWILLMETSFGNYPLFPRQYVQLGGVSCVVYYDGNSVNDDTHVVVSVQQTASYQIYDCVFYSEKNAFKLIPVYHSQPIIFLSDSKYY